MNGESGQTSVQKGLLLATIDEKITLIITGIVPGIVPCQFLKIRHRASIQKVREYVLPPRLSMQMGHSRSISSEPQIQQLIQLHRYR